MPVNYASLLKVNNKEAIMPICTKCCLDLDEKKFATSGGKRGSKKRYRRKVCRKCDSVGKCKDCMKPLESGTRYCKRCLKRRRLRKNCSLYGLFKRFMKRACLRGIQCDLTIEQLLILHAQQAGLCAVTKLPMLIRHDDLLSISVDRVDNTKHYTITNVILVCRWVNWARNKFSIQEFTEKVLVPLIQGSQL